MKVISGISRIKKFRKPVVAVGVFDGMHRGHAAILRQAVRQARSSRGTSVAVTFYPHPQKKKSLYSLEHRLRLMSEIGMDACVVISFDKRFSRMSAEEFVRDILIKRLGCTYVFVGKNFRLGRGARADASDLKILSKRYGFKLRALNVERINGRAISSTYIRSLISSGELSLARRLLERPVAVLGTVIRGSSLATKIGFPTANIDPHHEVLPPDGIYAVRIIYRGRNKKGICYIGTRPTLKKRKEDKGKRHIEVHIFDFNKKIYGEYLEIQFIRKIRKDNKFRNIRELALQIRKDVSKVKHLLSRHPISHNI